jgi:type IV pilus assembly protein PilW
MTTTIPCLPSVRRQGGLTLVEMMVTIAIALFLLAGVGYMLQNTRRAYANQNQLQQLQDSERLAMTLLTDVIQNAGYFPDPTQNTIDTALPAVAGTWVQEQAITAASQAAPAPGDAITVRYMTTGGDGILNCLGTSNTQATGTTDVYVNQFYLTAPDASGNSTLQCKLTDSAGTVNSTQDLVSGLTNMQIWFGVKRGGAATDNNVDTYLRPSEMSAGAPNDWLNITSVRIVLTFQNPLAAPSAPATQKTIDFERVIAVMNRAGVT